MMVSKINLRKKIGQGGERQTRVKRRLLVETLCERRVLATVTGMVFDDLNATWRQDAEEASLAGRLVFVDSNDNGLPDDGEAFALTDADGSFSFDELGSDDQIVRLFSGAPSQRQLFPIHPDRAADLIALGDFDPADAAGNLLIAPSGNRAVVQVAGGVIVADLAARTVLNVDLGATPVASEFLADGRILVLASDELGNHAFLIDADGIVAPIDLFASPDGGEGGAPEGFAGWSDVAINADGKGVLTLRGDSDPLRARMLVVEDGSLSTIGTATSISPNAALIGGGSVTTVIAEPIEGGLALSLWSNLTGTVISAEPAVVAGADSVLGYSESTGLLFAFLPPQSEASSGSVVVLDVEADFAVVQTLTGLDDLVAIDTARSVVFSLSTKDSRLRAIDALTAETVADWMIEMDLAAKPTELALHVAGNKLVLLGAAGLATVSLDRIDAHRVKVDGSIPQYPLRFSVKVEGDNQPPMSTQSLEFNVVQGNVLLVPHGGLVAEAVDPDGDPFVVVRSSSPAHGVATVSPFGGMTYTADSDFVGTDSFEIFLHDGRGPSSPITVQITVSPFVAPEPDVVITILPVPENAEADFVVGKLEIIGFGAGPLIFVIEDPRFQVVDNLIVVVHGAVLDYEDQFLITTNLTVSNPETEQTVTRSFTVQLSDEDDPIEDIQPRSATIFENVAGELIAELMVIDQDAEQPFILTVDDDRFEIVNRNLRLKPGVSLDYEASPEVVINITATDALGGGDSLTVPFTITVIDVAEPAGSIALSNSSVLEFVSGAIVGDVIVDGNPLRDSYIAAVDDSRFEIVNGVLKLRDDAFLSRSDQQEAQVIITVQDVGQMFAPTAEIFVIMVLENENPFHNSDSPFDVNGDGMVNPLDALLILNALSRNGGGGPVSEFPPPGQFWDVNGDGLITPLDALLVLNFINQQNRLPPVSEPESAPSQGEPISTFSQNESDLDVSRLSTPGDRFLSSQSVARPLLLEPIQRGALIGRILAPEMVARIELALQANPLLDPSQREAATERVAALVEQIQQALTAPRAESLFDQALEMLNQRPELLAAIDGFRTDLQRLQQSLRERLSADDLETLERWKSAIADRILTPEIAARIELVLERINRV